MLAFICGRPSFETQKSSYSCLLSWKIDQNSSFCRIITRERDETRISWQCVWWITKPPTASTSTNNSDWKIGGRVRTNSGKSQNLVTLLLCICVYIHYACLSSSTSSSSHRIDRGSLPREIFQLYFLLPIFSILHCQLSSRCWGYRRKSRTNQYFALHITHDYKFIMSSIMARWARGVNRALKRCRWDRVHHTRLDVEGGALAW